MPTTYIHHSCFLVETTTCYYLFDYEKGILPAMDVTNPIFVLSSHAHRDHYNAAIFTMLREQGMQRIYGILSSDIKAPADVDVTPVSLTKDYREQINLLAKHLNGRTLDAAFVVLDPRQGGTMTEAYVIFWSMYLSLKYIPCIIGASLR